MTAEQLVSKECDQVAGHTQATGRAQAGHRPPQAAHRQGRAQAAHVAQASD